MDQDIRALAEAIKSLPQEEALEASLCLLNSLLPHQLLLDSLAERSSDPELKKLASDFTEYLTNLRDALLG